MRNVLAMSATGDMPATGDMFALDPATEATMESYLKTGNL
jgi:hypothetical protein